jgi:hypothetical protein
MAIAGLQHDKCELVEREDASDETMTMVPYVFREKDMAHLFHHNDTYASPAF